MAPENGKGEFRNSCAASRFSRNAETTPLETGLPKQQNSKGATLANLLGNLLFEILL